MSILQLLSRPPHVRCLSSRLSQVRRYALIGKPMAPVEPRWTLPKTPTRTRFAPSPTGYLHLGSLRTALYNYLLAQATGGQFIIRLEDTDQSRLVGDAEQVLYDDLRWAGLLWDEGPDKGGPFGPYRQSERLDLYRQHADALLESGHAFRCFCTKEELDHHVAQATAHGGAASYPGTCTHVERSESDRRAANGEPHVIRFKPAGEPRVAHDIVYGAYKKADREDSFIIMKSDGFPTYHFANVVDDHFMEITHVIRGAEWLISTPKHVELYNAFGWQPPNFAHVGLLVDSQRQKLSKRDMANIGVSVYRSNAVMPEALLNFSALLGWDPNLQRNLHLHKKGIMTMQEMKENFTLKFTRGDIIVDLQKLKFFQSKLTRNLISGQNPDHATLRTRIIQPILNEVQKLDDKLANYLKNDKVDDNSDVQHLLQSIAPRPEEPALTEDYVLQVLKASKGPVDHPTTFLHDNIYAFYRPSKESMRRSYAKLQTPMKKIMILEQNSKILNTDISKVLRAFNYKLKGIDPDEWSEKIEKVVYDLTDTVKYYNTDKGQDNIESAGWKFMRHGILNGNPGLGIIAMMQLLGQSETRHRLRDARKVASQQEDMAMRSMAGELEEKAAAKVSTRRLTPGPGGKTAEQAVAIRNNMQRIELRAVKTHEPENQTVRNREEARQAVPPPDMGPISIPGNEAGTSRDQMLKKEGPSKAQPPMPSPKSPAEDPSKVQRAPKILSIAEFKHGMRNFKHEEKRDVALYKIEELQAQERARRRELEATKAARAYVEEVSKGGGWATPRAALIRGAQKYVLPEGRGLFLPGDPFPGDRRAHIIQNQEEIKEHTRQNEIWQSKSRASAEGRLQQSLKPPSLGPMYASRTLGGQPRDLAAHKPSASPLPAQDSNIEQAMTMQPSLLTRLDRNKGTLRDRAEVLLHEKMRKSTPGPFKPAGTVSQIDDVDRHVKHLRALNRTLAIRRAKQRRLGQAKGATDRKVKSRPHGDKTILNNLKASGTPGPLSPRARGHADALRQAWSARLSKLASDVAAVEGQRSWRDAEHARADAPLPYTTTRQAAAAANEAPKMKRDHKALTGRFELQMVQLLLKK